MTSKASVRAVSAADRDEWGRMWQAYLGFYETERPQAVFDETWARIMAGANNMHAGIAEVDGHAVGIVNFLYHHYFWGSEPRIYLNDLFVDPNTRGTGAGRALIEYVEGHGRTNGAGSIYWLTAEDNAEARRLYDRIAQKSVFVHYTMKP